MSAPDSNSSKPTRRQFISRTLTGASLLGLGSATGLLASNGDPASSVKAAKSGRVLDEKFSYNLSAFTKIDPQLIRFAEKEPIATGFSEVRGLFITPDDQLYVAGDQSVRVFDKSGRQISEIAIGDAPRCVSVSDLVFVGMEKHIEVFAKSGVRQAKWENLDDKAIITSISASEHDVFVADAGNRVVLRYDRSGKLLKIIGKKDLSKNIPGFAVPSPYFHLAIGPDGLLWVVNPARHQLEAYTFDGELEKSWGETANAIHGFCGCCNPVHFTQMPDGRFVTSEKGLPRVKIYSAKGEFECVVAAPSLFPKQLENPKAAKVCMDLAVDSSGQILLADAVVGKIRIFSPKSASDKTA